MRRKFILPILLSLQLFPGSALAQDSGYFAGIDVYGGAAFGSSSTTDGGAPGVGGGIVDDVKFGASAGVGGNVGYRFDSGLSTFVSYQYFRSDVSWNATYPLFGIGSDFEGAATSHVLMVNAGYDLALSDAASIRTSAGAGLSLNSLSGIVETEAVTGQFGADLEDGTRISPAAQIGTEFSYKFAPNAVLGLSALVSYTGGFKTGDTRTGNLGVTAINPYEIDGVWRVNLGASLRYQF